MLIITSNFCVGHYHVQSAFRGCYSFVGPCRSPHGKKGVTYHFLPQMGKPRPRNPNGGLQGPDVQSGGAGLSQIPLMDEDCHSPLPSAVLPAVLPQGLRAFHWVPKGPHTFSCPRPSVQLGGCQFAYREDQGENDREMLPILPGPTAFQPATSSRTAQSHPATRSTSVSVLCSHGQRITLCWGFRDSRAFLAPKEVVPVPNEGQCRSQRCTDPPFTLLGGRTYHTPCLKTSALSHGPGPRLQAPLGVPHAPGS